MRVLLISTYELGHQPFGLASPAAWLKNAGAEVNCVDLAVQSFAESQELIAAADLIAFYLPMHTATKLAIAIIERVIRLSPEAHLCAYGLYAPVNEAYLRRLGVSTILGGEFEQGLKDWYVGFSQQKSVELPLISLQRQQFQVPDRSHLPSIERYAYVETVGQSQRVAGYTEASRGCKHTCRHCPIVPVYNGRFRVVQQEIVLADIRQQVAAGAQHITFGDPDFLNGPGHATALVKALHAEHPQLTYDVTIKIEHLVKYDHYLPVLRGTGCLYVTSAVETIDERILALFQKGHTRADFEHVVQRFRQLGLALVPTFVAFTPWTSPRSYADLLATIDNLGLVGNVSPIQYAIRLLIPAQSKLLDLPETKAVVGPFDSEALVYRWDHPDPRMDALYQTVFRLVKANQRSKESRRVHFERVWQEIVRLLPDEELPQRSGYRDDQSVPTFSEDWY